MVAHAPAPAEQDTAERPASPVALWRHLFGEGHGFLCLLSGRRRAPGDKRLLDVAETYWPYPQSLAFAEQEAYQQDALGREVYFCAHLLRRKRRVKASAGPIDALWTDGDGAPAPSGALCPTAIVDSSPGRRQYFWRLAEPVEPAEAEGLNRRLAYAIGADKGGWDLTQLLRVPGCTNHKYPDGPRVAVWGIAPERVVDAAALDGLLPPAPAPLAPPPFAAEADDIDDIEPPVRLGADGLAWWRGERVARKDDGSTDRSETLWGIACELWDAGASRGTLLAALAERDRALGHECFTARPEEYARIARKLAEREEDADSVGTGRCPQLVGKLAAVERDRDEWRSKATRYWEELVQARELLALPDKHFGRSMLGLSQELEERAERGETKRDPQTGDLFIHVNNVSTGKRVNHSDELITRDTQRAEAAGLLVVKYEPVAIEKVDRQTGEKRTEWGKKKYVALRGASTIPEWRQGVVEAFRDVASNHGGKRKPRPVCPDHPTAGTITRTTIHCAIASCDKPLTPPTEVYYDTEGERAERPASERDEPIFEAIGRYTQVVGDGATPSNPGAEGFLPTGDNDTAPHPVGDVGGLPDFAACPRSPAGYPLAASTGFAECAECGHRIFAAQDAPLLCSEHQAAAGLFGARGQPQVVCSGL